MCLCQGLYRTLPAGPPAMAKGKWKRYRSEELRAHQKKKANARKYKKYNKKRRSIQKKKLRDRRSSGRMRRRRERSISRR